MKTLKRLLALAVLALLPSAASAQNSNWYVPPWLQSSGGNSTTLIGPLLLPDGSAAAPALSFAGQPNKGIYSAGGNQVNIAVAGGNYHIFTAGGYSINNATATIGLGANVTLARDADNTLALRNSTNAQTFWVYNTYTDSSNYERGGLYWSGNSFYLNVGSAGTGINRGLFIGSGATTYMTGFWAPTPNDSNNFGGSGNAFQSGFFTRSVQGSKTKALTESSATAVTQIAVPQTAGANYADAKIEWVVYATDGTDSQTLKGSSYLTAVNKAGTETCTVGAVGTAINAVSAGTLTCTPSCITGLTDVVQFALNCVSSLTQTTFTAQARLDMMQPNTVTPQ